MNSNASIICQSHHNQIYKVQHQKGSRSLASKCPQRISGLSAPERDVTYTPSWSKLRPEVSQYNENKVSQYHKSIPRTKMETADAYHLRPPRSPSVDYNRPTGP
jgi:hypothetical protein